jgi:hypothetical protein
MKSVTSRLSGLAAVCMAALLIWRAVISPLGASLHWDGAGYYFYLPATFIYDDLPLEDRSWFEALRQKYDLSGTLYQVHPVPDRPGHVDQYSSGVAILIAPAFFVAHALAEPLGYEPDGFSPIYQYSVSIWSLALAVLAIFMLRRMLLRFFSDGVTAWVLVLLIACTNYLVQIPGTLVSPHNYLLLLFAMYLTAVHDWHVTAQRKHFYTAVACGAMAGLIRPTELTWFFILPFWGARTVGEMWRTVRHWFSEYGAMIVRGITLALLIISPQVAYWLITTGKPFYMSYANPGEGLDLTSPHTVDFLFSFRKGWFIYTPLAIVAVLGFIPMRKMRPEWMWAVGVFFLINLYLVSSWTTWWYAQCFSQRVMIHSFPLLAIPLGFALTWVRDAGKWRAPSVAVIALFAAVSIFFQWQYTHGILHGDRMTREYFFSVLGKTSITQEDTDKLLIERPFDGSMVFRNKDRYTLVRSADILSQVDESWSTDSTGAPEFRMHAENAFSPGVRFPFSELTTTDHAWIIAEAEVAAPEHVPSEDILMVTTAQYKGKVYGYYAWQAVRDSAGIRKFYAEYLTPEVRTKKDPVTVYIWYRGQDSVAVRGIRTRVFVRKDR